MGHLHQLVRRGGSDPHAGRRQAAPAILPPPARQEAHAGHVRCVPQRRLRHPPHQRPCRRPLGPRRADEGLPPKEPEPEAGRTAARKDPARPRRQARSGQATGCARRGHPAALVFGRVEVLRGGRPQPQPDRPAPPRRHRSVDHRRRRDRGGTGDLQEQPIHHHGDRRASGRDAQPPDLARQVAGAGRGQGGRGRIPRHRRHQGSAPAPGRRDGVGHRQAPHARVRPRHRQAQRQRRRLRQGVLRSQRATWVLHGRQPQAHSARPIRARSRHRSDEMLGRYIASAELRRSSGLKGVGF